MWHFQCWQNCSGIDRNCAVCKLPLRFLFPLKISMLKSGINNLSDIFPSYFESEHHIFNSFFLQLSFCHNFSLFFHESKEKNNFYITHAYIVCLCIWNTHPCPNPWLAEWRPWPMDQLWAVGLRQEIDCLRSAHSQRRSSQERFGSCWCWRKDFYVAIHRKRHSTVVHFNKVAFFKAALIIFVWRDPHFLTSMCVRGQTSWNKLRLIYADYHRWSGPRIFTTWTSRQVKWHLGNVSASPAWQKENEKHAVPSKRWAEITKTPTANFTFLYLASMRMYIVRSRSAAAGRHIRQGLLNLAKNLPTILPCPNVQADVYKIGNSSSDGEKSLKRVWLTLLLGDLS